MTSVHLHRFLKAFKERTGHEAAILDLTATHLHLELVSAGEANLQWGDPLTPIAGAAPGISLDGSPPSGHRSKTHCGKRLVRRSSADSPSEALEHLGSGRSHLGCRNVLVQAGPQLHGTRGSPDRLAGDRRPGAVPDVVATGPDWSLSRAFDPPSEERTSESPVRAYSPRFSSTSPAGPPRCWNWAALSARRRTLVAGLAALAHRGRLPRSGLSEQLDGALPRIRELVEQIDGSPISSSLVHGDLHGGNWTRASDGTWLIFDWTDGCVSHPFFDLGVLPEKDVELREARLEAYLEPGATPTAMQPSQRRLRLHFPSPAGSTPCPTSGSSTVSTRATPTAGSPPSRRS